jgi:hypothetical protein
VNILSQDGIQIINVIEPGGTLIKFGSLLVRDLAIGGKGQLGETPC